ncbi:MAG: VCBS repeat-containing protein [Planctomycetota bacterium]
MPIVVSFAIPDVALTMVSGTKTRWCGLVVALALARTTHAQQFPFEDVTAAAGIVRRASTYDAAAADFDLDGDLDIFVANHGEAPAFYVNDGRGQFRDRAPDWGLKSEDWHGFAFTDLNGDGYPDLLICSGAVRGEGLGPNRVSMNLRGQRFAPLVQAPEPLADAKGRHRSVICRDFDLNAITDYLFLNYASRNSLVLGLGGARYIEVGERAGVREFPGVVAAVTGCVTHLNQDDFLDLVAPGYPPVLLFGTGPAQFGPPSRRAW